MDDVHNGRRKSYCKEETVMEREEKVEGPDKGERQQHYGQGEMVEAKGEGSQKNCGQRTG